jgi:hypothetical protein
MEYLNEIDKGEEGAECNGSRMLSLNQRYEFKLISAIILNCRIWFGRYIRS